MELTSLLTPQLIVTFACLSVAIFTDVKSGMIYNWLTLPMIVLGLAMNASLGQFEVGAYGLVAATAIHFSLWKLRVEKGGDAKLFMGIGAMMGTVFMLKASVWLAVVFVPVAVFVIWRRGKAENMVATMHHAAAKAQGADVGEAPQQTMLIMAPLITVGAALACLPWP